MSPTQGKALADFFARRAKGIHAFLARKRTKRAKHAREWAVTEFIGGPK